MEMELQNPGILQETQKEAPKETLETLMEPLNNPPLPSDSLQIPPYTAPSLPPPETEANAGEGGGEKREANPSISENSAVGSVTDLEKKLRRAERFGMHVQLSEEEKRISRAERFGTGSTSLGKTDAGKNSTGKVEEEKRKARAERFGLTGQSPPDEEAKKKARLERFVQDPKPDTLEEGKRKARAARFSRAASPSSEANGKAKSELKTTVAETEGLA